MLCAAPCTRSFLLEGYILPSSLKHTSIFFPLEAYYFLPPGSILFSSSVKHIAPTCAGQALCMPLESISILWFAPCSDSILCKTSLAPLCCHPGTPKDWTSFHVYTTSFHGVANPLQRLTGSKLQTHWTARLHYTAGPSGSYPPWGSIRYTCTTHNTCCLLLMQQAFRPIMKIWAISLFSNHLFKHQLFTIECALQLSLVVCPQ
jgi:hypothetical protein